MRYQGWGRFVRNLARGHCPKARCTLQITRGLCSMPQCSAQILICLLTCFLQLSILCKWSRSPKFEDCHCGFYHCPLWWEWGWSPDNHLLSKHTLHKQRCSRMEIPSGIYAIELVQVTDEVNEILNNGKVINSGTKWMESFIILLHQFTFINPRT